MDFDEFFPPFFGSLLGTGLCAIVLSAFGLSGFLFGAGLFTVFVVIFWAMWEYN